MCIDCDPGYLPNVDGTMCEGIEFIKRNFTKYNNNYVQIPMSV